MSTQKFHSIRTEVGRAFSEDLGLDSEVSFETLLPGIQEFAKPK
jgi:hypothetical protein